MFIWRARIVSFRAITGRQPPGLGGVTLEMFGVGDAVRLIDSSDVAVILKIIGEAVGRRVRIESHIGIMSKEQRAPGSPAHVQLDPEMSFAIGVARSRTRIIHS